MHRVFSIAAVSVMTLLGGMTLIPPAAQAVEDDQLVEIGPSQAATTDERQGVGDALIAPEVAPTQSDEQDAEQATPAPTEGRIVPPGFGDPAMNEGATPVARYWIGLGGGVLPPEVRAQIDVADGEGVLVRSVVAEGPAAEAGVQLYDVLITAAGKPLSDMRQLAELVGELGEKGEPIDVVLLRRGKAESVVVTPIKRPVNLAEDMNPWQGDPRVMAGPFGAGPFGDGAFPGGLLEGQQEIVEGLLGKLQQQGAMRGGMFRFGAPGGVSISMEREANGPARAIVRRGDQVWEVEQGDAAALAALPDDIRPTVERMFAGQGAVPVIPPRVGGMPGFRERVFGGNADAMFQEQMQQMRRELDALRAQIEAPAAQQAVPQAAPQAQPAPSEVEIPAE
jgi:hypothetical protein